MCGNEKPIIIYTLNGGKIELLKIFVVFTELRVDMAIRSNTQLTAEQIMVIIIMITNIYDMSLDQACLYI